MAVDSQNAPVFFPREVSGSVPLIAGDRVGEYEVEGQIGEGGMGIVYSAMHPLIGKRVAIKVLKGHAVAQAELVNRFVHEARAVNRIAHPNIIDVFSFGLLPDGRHYFIMEMLEGESLEARLARDGTAAFDDLLPVFRQTAEAIDAAHQQGIIHRDLKPGNIYLTEAHGELRVKVLDFGIAKLADSISSVTTQVGVLLGTPLYMSPEQCRGLPVTGSADVYAFAVLLYEALTGEFPLYAESIPGLIFQHVSSVPRPPSLFGARRTLDAVFARALSKDPTMRHETLVALVDDIEAALAAPVEVAAVPARAQGKAATHRLSADTIETKASGTDRLSTQGPIYCRGHNSGVSWLAFSGDGNLLASAGDDGSVRLWNCAGDALAEMRERAERISRVVFSPSGHLVAVGAANGSVRVMSIFDGQVVRRYDHRRSVCDLAFTHDGAHLVSASADSTLAMCNMTTGVVRHLRGHTGPVRSVAISDDGIIASGGDDKTIRIWDDKRGRRETRHCGSAVAAIVFSPDGASLASAHHDGCVREWSLEQRSPRLYGAPAKSLRCLAYDPAGKVLAAGDSDGRVMLWSRLTTRPHILRGHEKRVRHVCFSPDGNRLASVSTDGTVRVWDVEQRRCEVIVSHGGAARHACFSPNGRLLASASMAAQITITPMPIREVSMRRARRLATDSSHRSGRRRHWALGALAFAGIGLGTVIAGLVLGGFI